jgi:hypothetical protein
MSNHVVRNAKPLAKDKAKALIAAGINRAVIMHGIEAVADAAQCSIRCLQKALSHETLPEADKLGNILLLEPTVLAEWLGKLGYQAIPTNAQVTPDMVTASQMSRAVAAFLEILEDGKRSPSETCSLADVLRPLIPRLTAIVHEADGLKVAA